MNIMTDATIRNPTKRSSSCFECHHKVLED